MLNFPNIFHRPSPHPSPLPNPGHTLHLAVMSLQSLHSRIFLSLTLTNCDILEESVILQLILPKCLVNAAPAALPTTSAWQSIKSLYTGLLDLYQPDLQSAQTAAAQHFHVFISPSILPCLSVDILHSGIAFPLLHQLLLHCGLIDSSSHSRVITYCHSNDPTLQWYKASGASKSSFVQLWYPVKIFMLFLNTLQQQCGQFQAWLIATLPFCFPGFNILSRKISVHFREN